MTKVELSNLAFMVRSYANNPTKQIVDLCKSYFPAKGSKEYVRFIKSFRKNPSHWVKKLRLN